MLCRALLGLATVGGALACSAPPPPAHPTHIAEASAVEPEAQKADAAIARLLIAASESDGRKRREALREIRNAYVLMAELTSQAPPNLTSHDLGPSPALPP